MLLLKSYFSVVPVLYLYEYYVGRLSAGVETLDCELSDGGRLSAWSRQPISGQHSNKPLPPVRDKVRASAFSPPPDVLSGTLTQRKGTAPAAVHLPRGH